MKTTLKRTRQTALLAAFLIPCVYAHAQAVREPANPAPAAQPNDDEVVTLSPFEVSAGGTEGYNAATTLAGNRLNTQLRDLGNSVTVVTGQFLKDIGATSNTSLLQYTTNTEVGGVYGNFAGVGDNAQVAENMQHPNTNTRVRGLSAADNTRDFFMTDIPWDSYNTERVDLQRGPNSIMFGQGSPSGIINAGSKGATFRNSGTAEVRYGSFDTTRASLDINQVLVKNEVGIRVNAVENDQLYKQDPAFSRDKRVAGAIRIEPAFLKKNGARTVLKANFESGQINSNNPRELTPGDNITPFFGTGNAGTKQQTLVGWGAWDHLTGRINHGQARTVYAAPNSGPIAYSSPWIVNANFGTSGGTEPVAFFGSDGAPSLWITEVSARFQTNGIGPDGKGDSDIQGLVSAPGTLRGIAGTSIWASNIGLPYSAAGIFKDNHLTDPSVFDFYNKLIDGDSKYEWQRFHTATGNLTQTFFNDQAGFSLDYNKEHYNSGQVALLGGNAQLFIDPMKVYNNGTPDAGKSGDPFSDGTANPNVGRPFVSSTGGANNSYTSEHESKRATAFVTHDFSKGEKTWLNRIIGTQTLTGLAAEDSLKSDSRVWNRFGYLEDNAYAIEHLASASNTFNQMTPTSIVYLGPSLLGKSINGANIPGVSGRPTISSGKINYFDDHWKWSLDPTASNYVNPSAPWTNYAYSLDPSVLAPGTQGNPTGYNSTQSENPANYVGWTSAQLNVTDSEAAAGNRETLTTSAALRKSITTSQALVWQGRMIDNAIVGTYGWRKDINKSWSHDSQVSALAGNPDYKQINFNKYQLPTAPGGRVEVQSRSYSIVGHLMDLPGLKQATRKLPFEVSLSYNVSTNFQPDSSRVDVLGQSIASPSGKTIDRGIMIETRDGRYSLRINRYVTSVKNSTSTNSGAFAYGLGDFMGSGANYCNVFQYNIGNWEWAATPQNYNQGNAMRFDYFSNNLPDTSGLEQKAIAGYRAFQKNIDPRFWQAWGYTSLDHVQSGAAIPTPGDVRVPAGFALTEDSLSKGWEVELAAQPLANWRLSLNLSKTDAVRNNIGGEALNKMMSTIIKDMAGDAGWLHYWWGTNDVPYAKDVLYNYMEKTGSDWASRKLLEGTKVPELCEYRANLVSNYEISTGRLKGVNFGGGMRYSSAVTIGYPPTGNPNDPASLGFDLAHPFKGPSETYFDGWVGYRHRITKAVNWHVQLNMANMFKKNALIPITAQGPINLPGYSQAAGSGAAYRIAPTQTFLLTNTFEF